MLDDYPSRRGKSDLLLGRSSDESVGLRSVGSISAFVVLEDIARALNISLARKRVVKWPPRPKMRRPIPARRRGISQLAATDAEFEPRAQGQMQRRAVVRWTQDPWTDQPMGEVCPGQTSHTDNVGRLRETTPCDGLPCGTPPIGVRTLTPHQRPCG